jgi:hypothetical protein
VPQVEVFFVLFCFAHNGRRKWCEKAHTAIRIHHLLIIARANTPKSGSAVDTRTSGVLHVQCCGDDGAKPRIPRHPNEGKSSHTHTHTHHAHTHTHEVASQAGRFGIGNRRPHQSVQVEQEGTASLSKDPPPW